MKGFNRLLVGVVLTTVILFNLFYLISFFDIKPGRDVVGRVSMEGVIIVDVAFFIINIINPENGAVLRQGEVSFIYEVNSTFNITQCNLHINRKNTGQEINVPINTPKIFKMFLSPGNYIWSISCIDSSGYTGSSPEYTLTILGRSVSRTYYPHIYYVDYEFYVGGNYFEMNPSDKIVFIVDSKTHTLTLNRFNSSSAIVTISSDPKTTILERDVLYEFDVNENFKKDIRVRYGGMNGTKGTIFIQRIMRSGDLDREIPSRYPVYHVLLFDYIIILFLILVFILILIIIIRNKFKKTKVTYTKKRKKK